MGVADLVEHLVAVSTVGVVNTRILFGVELLR